MRSSLRSAVPSMFQRRLILLTALALLIGTTLGIATAGLTTGQSFREARSEAEAKLQATRFTSTVRGRVLDRNGLELAKDEPGWEVAVHFSVITGDWAHEQAIADARADKLAWERMDDAQRDAEVESLHREYDQQVQMLFTTLEQLGRLKPGQMQDRRDNITRWVHAQQTHIWNKRQEQAEAERGEPVPRSEVEEPIAEQNQYHTVLHDLRDELRLQLEDFIVIGRTEGDRAEAWSMRVFEMVELRRLTVRRYPHDTMHVTLDRSTLPEPLKNTEPIRIDVKGVSTHLVGLMRDAWAEDVNDQPFLPESGGFDLSGYRGGDRLGQSGIEYAMEHVLRGTRGVRTTNLNTGEIASEVLPQAGRDVMLSVDIRLQAQVQAVMSPEFGLMVFQPWHGGEEQQDLVGMPFNGGAVVMDIASGDVLAAVTMPAVPRDELAEDPLSFWRDPLNRPMYHRGWQVPYPPGSTVKPLVVTAAITDRVLGENETIDTPGYLWENKPLVYRDWYWKVHTALRGEINGIEALKFSSNPFFGLLAERLIERFGRDRLPAWYRQFGLGVDPRIGLGEAINGKLIPQNHADGCFIAIGQGPVSTTPLQVCTAYARLVHGKMDQPPRLIVHPRLSLDAGPSVKHQPSASGRRVALEGMRLAASERDGTASVLRVLDSNGRRQPIFNVPGVTVMAKSGTADPDVRWIDYNFNEKVDPGEVDTEPRDHAWVVALVQPDGAPRPTHVVAVIVEHAGSGGQIAGPVVNQIIHALQQHRYLEYPPNR
ncbi:MAG: penicillin-binding transpeptidase domain-containing protein [Planctomycetota bacterium]